MPPTERRARPGPIQKVYRVFSRAFPGNEQILQRVDQVEDDLREILAEQRAAGADSPLRRYRLATDDPDAFAELRRTRDFRERVSDPSELTTALQLIRQQIELEDAQPPSPQSPLIATTDALGRPLRMASRGQKQLGANPPHQNQTVPPPSVLRSFGDGRVPVERQSSSVIPAIGRPEQIDDHPTNTQIIHLSDQSVMSVPSITRIISRYTNLQIIHIFRSWRRLFGEEGDDVQVRRILDALGIKISWGRIRDVAYYDESQMSPEYRDRRERYEKLFDRQDRIGDLDFMFNHGFLEIEIAERYYGSNGQIPMQQVADELGIKFNVVNFKLLVLDVWAGGQSQSPQIIERVAALQKRIDQQRTALSNDASMESYRNSFAVGSTLPPRSLPMSLWDYWREVYTLYQADSAGFDTLLGVRNASVLREYLNISGSDQKSTFEELGRTYSISGKRARQIIYASLTKLGVIS